MILNRRKLKKRLRWLVPLVLLVLLLTNKAFWRYIYPFPYREIITEEAVRNNIDPNLVAAVIKTESNFRIGAESKAGARGIMQIMPETGRWAAEKMNLRGFEPDDLYEAETNIRIGCWYLNDLNQEFRGNKILVMAAYNGGRGNVQAWIKQEGWTGEPAHVDKIPFPETRAYVKKVLKNYDWYRYLYKEINEQRVP